VVLRLLFNPASWRVLMVWRVLPPARCPAVAGVMPVLVLASVTDSVDCVMCGVLSGSGRQELTMAANVLVRPRIVRDHHQPVAVALTCLGTRQT
jgi:hypothetical protein